MINASWDNLDLFWLAAFDSLSLQSIVVTPPPCSPFNIAIKMEKQYNEKCVYQYLPDYLKIIHGSLFEKFSQKNWGNQCDIQIFLDFRTLCSYFFKKLQVCVLGKHKSLVNFWTSSCKPKPSKNEVLPQGEESFMITFKVKPLFCRKYAFSSGSKRSISGQHALLQLVSMPVGAATTKLHHSYRVWVNKKSYYITRSFWVMRNPKEIVP